MSSHIKFPLTSNPRGLLRCSGDSSGCRWVWAHSVMKDRVPALYSLWCSSKVHIPAPNEYRVLNTQDVYSTGWQPLIKETPGHLPSINPKPLLDWYLFGFNSTMHRPWQLIKVQRIKVENWRAFYKKLIQYIKQYSIVWSDSQELNFNTKTYTENVMCIHLQNYSLEMQ